MKALIITLITGIVLSQLGISVGASSENSAARDLAAAKSLAFGGVGVAGLMSEGERNLRAVLQQPDASQQLQAALAHATPAGDPNFVKEEFQKALKSQRKGWFGGMFRK